MSPNRLSAKWLLRPAEKRDAAFLGWACVAAARSHRPIGWFDIVAALSDVDPALQQGIGAGQPSDASADDRHSGA